MIGPGERIITLAKVAEIVPNGAGGRGVNESTPVRWSRVGVRGVTLETRLYGGVRLRSMEAVERFFDAINGSEKPASGRPSKKRQAEIAAAEKALAAAGI